MPSINKISYEGIEYDILGEELAEIEDDTNQLKEDYTTILDSAYATDTVQGEIASFPDGADNVPVKSLSVAIEPVQSGSGDPSPTNVRPISGWTGANVTRTGKNLVNIPSCTIAQAGAVYPTAPLPQALPAGTYTAGVTSSAEAAWVLTFRDASNNTVGTFSSNQALAGRQIKTATLSATATQVSIYVNAGTTLSDIMFEFGSTASDYEAFTDSDTVSIDWTTEAGTIYGGTLDVTTGVLTVDRAIVDMGTLPWNKISGSGSVVGYQTASVPNIKPNSSDSAIANIVCSAFKPSSVNNGYSGTDKECITENTVGRVTVYTDGGYADGTAFKNAMVGQTFVYPLATPQVIQLTANDIETLLGQNNIWSDAGDVDVEYRADTKLYIEKLTAPTEDDMIADHAISANSFFMVGNTLYRATTAIASGATITVGTNATKLSLSDALNALS